MPFIEGIKNIGKESSILEVGCGEGGNLVPFCKRGYQNIVGIDLSKNQIENAKCFFEEFENHNKVTFINDDIYNINPETIGQFDLIIMRDVLEHIHNQEKFMKFILNFLKDDGLLFIGFPPWQNPFGGHQQLCKSKILSKMPYFHLLPSFLYKIVLSIFGESRSKIKGLLEIKETGISIERFNKVLGDNQYLVNKKQFYFVNPNYEVKFGFKPRKIWNFLSIFPFFRNFFITTVYFIISKKVRKV